MDVPYLCHPSILSGITRFSAKPSSLVPNINANIRKPMGTKAATPHSGNMTRFATPFAQRFLIKFHTAAQRIPRNAIARHTNSTFEKMANGLKWGSAATVNAARSTRHTVAGIHQLLKYCEVICLIRIFIPSHRRKSQAPTVLRPVHFIRQSATSYVIQFCQE